MLGHHRPRKSNPSFVRSCRAKSTSTGPKLGQCQHANNDVLPITLTIAHVGPTIACYLGLSCLEVPCHPLADPQDIPGYVSTKTLQSTAQNTLYSGIYSFIINVWGRLLF